MAGNRKENEAEREQARLEWRKEEIEWQRKIINLLSLPFLTEDEKICIFSITVSALKRMKENMKMTKMER